MTLKQVRTIKDGDETFEVWSNTDASNWEIRKSRPSAGDPGYSSFGGLSMLGQDQDLTSPEVVVRDNIYVNNYTNADLSLDVKNQVLNDLKSGFGESVNEGFDEEETPPPQEENEDGGLDFADISGLQEKFKGLQKSDSILQRLSLKNLKYPIDADYGNTQDYIQINQFTYQAINPSIIFPKQSQPISTDSRGLDFTDPESFNFGLSPGRGGQLATRGYGAEAKDTLLGGLKSDSPKEIPVGLVKLPMPNQLNDSNNVAWGEDQLNALTAAAATIASGGFQESVEFIQKIAAGDVKGLDIFRQILGKAGEGGKGLLSFLGDAAKNPNAQLNARSVIGSSLLNLAGFGVSPEAILARGAGVIPNSNLALLFNAPTLRAFRFDWKMSPRSQEEAIRINNIIRFFKQGMAAKKMQESGGRSYFLGTPNVFDIAFKTSKTNREITNTNHSVLRIKTCACVGAAVNYTPQGMWNAYEKGQPTSCILSLQFKELEPIYSTDYEEDPFEYDNLAGFVPSDAVGY